MNFRLGNDSLMSDLPLETYDSLYQCDADTRQW